MFSNISLMSMEASIQWDVLVSGNPSKERHTWKGVCDVVVHDRYRLQEELIDLKKKMAQLSDLQKKVDAHNSFSIMDAKHDKLTNMKRRVDDAIDEGLDTIFRAFKDTDNYVDLLCPKSLSSRSDLDLEKFVQDDAIIEDYKALEGGQDE